jgi:hypothetical protein
MDSQVKEGVTKLRTVLDSMGHANLPDDVIELAFGFARIQVLESLFKDKEVLIIYPDPQGGRYIRWADRYNDGLTPDECLAVCASFLMQGRNFLKWLNTKEEHERMHPQRQQTFNIVQYLEGEDSGDNKTTSSTEEAPGQTLERQEQGRDGNGPGSPEGERGSKVQAPRYPGGKGDRSTTCF